MKRAKVVPYPPSAPVEDRAAIVDEYGRLDARLREVEALKKRREVLREKILGWHENAAADAHCTSDGTHYTLLITPCERRRNFSMLAIKAKLGIKRLLDICTVSFEKLKSEIGEADAEALCQWERSGPRRIVVTETVVEKAA